MGERKKGKGEQSQAANRKKIPELTKLKGVGLVVTERLEIARIGGGKEKGGVTGGGGGGQKKNQEGES